MLLDVLLDENGFTDTFRMKTGTKLVVNSTHTAEVPLGGSRVGDNAENAHRQDNKSVLAVGDAVGVTAAPNIDEIDRLLL